MSRVAVVTGGARGLGWAIGTCLRDEGWGEPGLGFELDWARFRP